MANTVTLGHLFFKSEAAANKHFRAMLSRVEDNVGLAGQDFEDVQVLLENHENAEEKIGSGIVDLFVAVVPENNSRCFHVLRTDGTSDHFSVPKAVKGFTSPRMRFMQAARATVKEYVASFKSDYFRQHADENGCVQFADDDSKYSRPQTDVDHDPPFRKIADDFLIQQNLSVDGIEYTTKETIGTRFANEAIKEQFFSYHKSVAKLSVMPLYDNRKKAWMARADRSAPR